MKALIDTNILVYGIDSSDQKKHKIATDFIRNIFIGEAYISSQNIGEFCYQINRKLKGGEIEKVKLLGLAILKSKNWKKISYNEYTIWNALDKHNKKHDFWDLVLYFTMLQNGITKIVTENEDDFKGLDGIEIINPFRASQK